jgi:hypothetical protein
MYRDPDYMPTVPARYTRHLRYAGDTSTPESNDRDMDKFRNDFARSIFLPKSS